MYTLLADVVVILHMAFIVFVVLGGLLALVWRWVPWLHIPAAVWGALTEFLGLVCPLTPLENSLREAGTGEAYTGDFVSHYVLPLIYPAGLTEAIQWVLGGIVVIINLVIYTYVWVARR